MYELTPLPLPPDPDRVLFMTGATGHTGSRLARRLLERGWSLRCLNHNPDHARYLPRSPRLELIRGDITQPESYARALRGAVACYNIAHIGFAEPLIAACRLAGVERLISMSSTRRFTAFPEASAARVIEGEAALAASDLQWTVIRSAMIYGGDRDNNMEKLVRWLRRVPVMPLLRGGRNRVQPIFVWDLVDALERALDAPEAAPGVMRQAVTVAGPEPLDWRQMVETIATGLGRGVFWVPVPYPLLMAAGWGSEQVASLRGGRRKPWMARAQVRRLLEDKTFDIGPACAALPGWQPRSFPEGIALKLRGEA